MSASDRCCFIHCAYAAPWAGGVRSRCRLEAEGRGLGVLCPGAALAPTLWPWVPKSPASCRAGPGRGSPGIYHVPAAWRREKWVWEGTRVEASRVGLGILLGHLGCVHTSLNPDSPGPTVHPSHQVHEIVKLKRRPGKGRGGARACGYRAASAAVPMRAVALLAGTLATSQWCAGRAKEAGPMGV